MHRHDALGAQHEVSGGEEAWRYGPQCRELITFAPDERIEALFGRLPPLRTPAALAAGFRHDQDVDRLIVAAMQAN
ncbi:hypothetical protein [Duganella radicis]|uniref:Uncharacterized protein n=1 Tax=Duganella radicis TaxID=551988 RepID=A0A6L6PD96_9BURK|nr:hypothetical protein [Duganella radicis]MTV36571.1 hypothetical protein [Duganella radicis]